MLNIIKVKEEFIMKMTKYFTMALLTVSLVMLQSCDNLTNLDEEAHSQLAPENVLNNEEGIESVLASAYSSITWPGRDRFLYVEEWPTDIAWQTGGGENRAAVQWINWIWDPTMGLFNAIYNRHYSTIRDVNTILENVEQIEGIPEQKADALIAEARALRAWAYYRLYIYFGPTPLRTSTQDDFEMPRASEDEFLQFIEDELTAVIPDLPEPGNEPNYGRVNSGGMMGLLTKFYLNTRQWQEAADAAQDVIDSGYYELFPVYEDMFKVQHNGPDHPEFMLVNTAHPEGPGGLDGMNAMNATFPPGFQEWPEKNLLMQSNWNNWASQYRLLDSFFESFEEGDLRRELILVEYVNVQGDTVNLREDFNDNTRAFKYWPDPNANGNLHGNDAPEIRYADILLARAEALNELNGPNQESIDLINQVRDRAGLDDLTLADFGSTEDLRLHILDERKWEFYYEGTRRQDLRRHDLYVKNAQDRGIENAAEYRSLYPLPQPAIDANPELEQNPNY